MHIVRDPFPADEDRGNLSSRIAIVGLGNSMRGDDGAGALCVATLRDKGGAPATYFTFEQPLDLVDMLEGFDGVIVVDAWLGDLPCGQIVALTWPSDELADYRSPSTHTISLTQALALAQALGHLPERVRIFGISGKNFDTGQPISDAVRAGVDDAARQIVEVIEAWLENS